MSQKLREMFPPASEETKEGEESEEEEDESGKQQQQLQAKVAATSKAAVGPLTPMTEAEINAMDSVDARAATQWMQAERTKPRGTHARPPLWRTVTTYRLAAHFAKAHSDADQLLPLIQESWLLSLK